MSKKPVGVFTATIGILLCIVIFIDGPAIALLAYTKWEIRNEPELWIVPTPLTDLSIERSAGQKFSFLGYEFESPWTEVKKETKGESISILNFSNGDFISISKGADDLKAMKQDAARRGTDIKDVFGSQPTSSNYALRSKILYLTPRDLRLFSSPRQMAANSVLLTLKEVWTATAKGGLYSFQTKWLRGFQEGSPARNNPVTIYAFDEQDREIDLSMGTEPNANSRLSQADINRVLYSLRPISPSPAK
ncbi:MAG TPA: hypothetical protein VNF00_04310 [Candidatus Acidoferrales bacterium]|nr:hypothetical protein [Candidatus Acidoferrales bacterium]